MTDEKKKPEEGELSEEQLDDVAGGMFPAGQKTGGLSVSPIDVCKTPTPVVPVPMPYPNVADGSDGTETTTKGDTTKG